MMKRWQEQIALPRGGIGVFGARFGERPREALVGVAGLGRISQGEWRIGLDGETRLADISPSMRPSLGLAGNAGPGTTYDRLPRQIDVRLVRVNVAVAGLRVQSLVVVMSSLCYVNTCSHEDSAALYRRRWSVEPQLRDLKSGLRLDVLRCKTPAAVRQELWTGLLAYNLIRLSFTAAQQLAPNARTQRPGPTLARSARS